LVAATGRNAGARCALIALEPIVKGLVSPVKGVVAPSLPSTLPAGVEPLHQNVIVEMRRNGGVVGNPSGVWRPNWLQINRNGGDIAFGPDGMLCIGIGEGGGADDTDGPPFINGPIQGHGPNGNAQNLTSPFGKIHCIDVNTRSPGQEYGILGDNPFAGRPGAVGEIYACGLRNPYRMSFDRGTGRLLWVLPDKTASKG
jgi:glucose/arabinose dehydrogenase